MWGYLSDPFQYPFMQRALLEVLLLSVPAGLLGCWIVLRRLSFLTHAVGAATFPGLVLGFGLAFSPWLGAFGVAAGFVGAQTLLERRARLDPGAITGLLLATCLAAGSVLVSNVFHSSATVDGLLFGSLLGIDQTDIYARARARRGVCRADARRGARAARDILRAGHRRVARLPARPSTTPCCCCCSVRPSSRASAAIGGFVVSGLLVVPAATARLLARSVRQMQIGGVALAAVESDARARARVPPRRPARRRDRRARRVGLPGRRDRRAVVPPSRAAASRAGARGRAARGAVPGRGHGRRSSRSPVAHDRGRRDHDAAAGSRSRNVGGTRVSVTGILKPNVDPHEYEPRPSDAVALNGAKLIVESGVGLDSWMGKLIDEAGGSAPGVRRLARAEDPPRRRRGARRATRTGGTTRRTSRRRRPPSPRRSARSTRVGARRTRGNARRYVGELEAMDAANMRDVARAAGRRSASS